MAWFSTNMIPPDDSEELIKQHGAFGVVTGKPYDGRYDEHPEGFYPIYDQGAED